MSAASQPSDKPNEGYVEVETNNDERLLFQAIKNLELSTSPGPLLESGMGADVGVGEIGIQERYIQNLVDDVNKFIAHGLDELHANNIEIGVIYLTASLNKLRDSVQMMEDLHLPIDYAMGRGKLIVNILKMLPTIEFGPPSGLQEQHDVPKAPAWAMDNATAVAKSSSIDYQQSQPHSNLKVQLEEDDIKFMQNFQRKIDLSTSTSANIPTMDNVFGFDELKREIMNGFILPRKFGQLHSSNALLVFGPPGGGKTLIVKAAAAALPDYKFLEIQLSDIVDSYIAKNVQKLKAAFQVARDNAPCIIFFDEIDGLFMERTTSRNEYSKEPVFEFLAQYDITKKFNSDQKKEVFIIGASNHPSSIDSAVRRRLNTYIPFPLPDMNDRRIILGQLLGENLSKKLEPTHWKILELKTYGFTCADLNNFAQECKNLPFKKACDATHFKPVPKKDTEYKHFAEFTRECSYKIQEGRSTGFVGSMEYSAWLLMMEAVFEIGERSEDLSSWREEFDFKDGYMPVWKNSPSKQSWSPCSSMDPAGVKRTLMDFQRSEVIFPDVNVCDIIHVASCRKPTLDVTSKSGPVKECQKFAKSYGYKCLGKFNFDDDNNEHFDADACLQETRRTTKTGCKEFDDIPDPDVIEECLVWNDQLLKYQYAKVRKETDKDTGEELLVPEGSHWHRRVTKHIKRLPSTKIAEFFNGKFKN